MHAWLAPFCVSFWVNGHHHRVLNHRSISLFLSHTSRLPLIHLVFFLSLSMVKTASALTGSNITHSTGYKIFIYQMEKLGEYLSEDEMAIFPFKFTFPPWLGLCIIRLTASVLRQRARSASRNTVSYTPDKYVSVTEIKKIMWIFFNHIHWVFCCFLPFCSVMSPASFSKKLSKLEKDIFEQYQALTFCTNVSLAPQKFYTGMKIGQDIPVLVGSGLTHSHLSIFELFYIEMNSNLSN